MRSKCVCVQVSHGYSKHVTRYNNAARISSCELQVLQNLLGY